MMRQMLEHKPLTLSHRIRIMYQILQELRELLLENLRYERSKTICAHEYDRSIIGSKELELTCNPEINDYVICIATI